LGVPVMRNKELRLRIEDHLLLVETAHRFRDRRCLAGHRLRRRRWPDGKQEEPDRRYHAAMTRRHVTPCGAAIELKHLTQVRSKVCACFARFELVWGYATSDVDGRRRSARIGGDRRAKRVPPGRGTGSLVGGGRGRNRRASAGGQAP